MANKRRSMFSLALIVGPIFLALNCFLFLIVSFRKVELQALHNVSIEVKTLRDDLTESLSQLESGIVEKKQVSRNENANAKVNAKVKVNANEATALEIEIEEQNKDSTLQKQVPSSQDHDVDKENGQNQITPEELAEWKVNVCGSIKDNICRALFVLPKKKVSFCSAAEVYTTTTKQYFFDIAEGSLVIPEGAKFGVHEANWKRFDDLDDAARKFILKSEDWTHVFVWKHVVERFVSGYLNKVVDVCENSDSIKPHFAISHYVQYGFSCEEHKDLDTFVGFMETLEEDVGHFRAQSTLCSVGKYPFTDKIKADEDIDSKLEVLSRKLGVEHPPALDETIAHETIDKDKMIGLLRGKPELVTRILKIFDMDCANIPEACDVEELMSEIRT